MELTQEYIDSSILKGDEMYDKVVEQARKNGSVSVTWVQQVFRLNWHSSAHIVGRMEQEGLCELYKGGNGHRKIIQ
ncbi:DNA translocase FtsK [Brevibacillus porteri]|uniref:DNA translocase FtsK n=1 Tax=Brevibacillus porteri TaxID=2126350 RepID=UPI0036437E5A